MWVPIITNKNEIEFINSELLHISNKIELTSNYSLFGGLTGIAIFYYYYFKLTGNYQYKDQANTIILNCLKSINEIENDFSFSNGYTGICYTLLALRKNGFINFEPKIIFKEIDNNVSIETLRNMQINIYDFLYGGIGGGLYFLERLPEPLAKKTLSKIIDLLYIHAKITNDTICWNDNFALNSKENEYTEQYNLGLAHGVPSIIYFLSILYKNNIDKNKCYYLLNGSINWLLKQKLQNPTLSLFPHSLPLDKYSSESRLGWCYGDLGIGTSLYIAGCHTLNQYWKNIAIEILIHSSKRYNLELNSVNDACLCHGTSGIALMYNRIYQKTKIKQFKIASLFWYNQTIQKGININKYNGYKTMYRIDNKNKWLNSNNLIHGISGIGLSLISAISTIEPKWDRCLLIS
ncbi:MAG: lanthionine synthetase C family protein [Saprospiraceae bacterium]|nr:lanthionine synthetase C family protein [Saprospiraceae bacterium]